MKNLLVSKVGVAITIVIVGLAGLFGYAAIQRRNPSLPPISVFPAKQKVHFLTVYSGDEFDIVLWTGERYHARLTVRTPPEAKDKLVLFLNQCHDPQVVLRRKMDAYWEIDLFVKTTVSEVNIIDWLSQNHLIWQ